MTVTQSSSPAAHALGKKLLSIRRGQRAAARRARFWQALAATGAAVLALLMIDALCDFSPWARCGGDGLVIAGVIWGMRRLRLGADDPQRGAGEEARRLDQRFSLAHEPLQSAWELSAMTQPPLTLTTALAGRSVDHGTRVVGALSPAETIDRKLPRGQRAVLLAIAMPWMMIALLMPPEVGNGLLRFLDPWGDHPPFGLTRFTLTLTPEKITQGQDALVTARLRGIMPRQVELVELNPAGQTMARWPMTSGERNLFTRRLADLREPMVVRVESPTGRSHKLRIDPVAPPSPKAKPPDPMANKQQGQTATAPVETPMDAAQAARAAMIELGQQAADAQRLAELAQQLVGQLPEGEEVAIPPWLAKELDALLRRAALHAQRNADLARQLRQLAAECKARGGDPRLCNALGQCAGMLESMALSKAGPRGSGRGGGVPMPEQLRRLMNAARQDQRSLANRMTAFDRALAQAAGGTSSGRQSPTNGPTRLAEGEAGETVAAGTHRDSSDSAAEQAPPAYRELTAKYFERLAHDAVAGDANDKPKP